MSWYIGNSRNLYLSLKNNLGLYHVVLKENSQKLFLTITELQCLPVLNNLDIEEQISEYKWTLYNGRRKVLVVYRSDLQEIEITEYRRNKNLWIIRNKMTLQKSEYEKMLEYTTTIECYTNYLQKTCIDLQETTIS